MMEFNRNLVICSISLGRMKLIDKLYFKEEFPGNIYIIMDDRNPIRNDIIAELENFIKNEATNPNLKKAIILHYKRDMLSYIQEKIAVRSDIKDVVEKMIFSIPMLSHIYFNRNENDLTFLLDDDIILFKNPIYLMDGKLRGAIMKPMPANVDPRYNDFLRWAYGSDEIFEKLGLDPNAKDNNLVIDNTIGRIVSQPSTIWNYQPDFPKFIKTFLEDPITFKYIQRNRKKMGEFYNIGFTFVVERLLSCFLLAHDAEYYGDTFITQDREFFIKDYKKIYNGEVFGYHYIIINDQYVWKYLPLLMEQGPDAYKKLIKDIKGEAKGTKYSYLKPSQLVNFGVAGIEKKEEKPNKLF